MLNELYKKLSATHKEEFILIKEKRLYDAFVMLKNKNDYGSKILISVIYILLGKNRDAVLRLKELEHDKKFLEENIISLDVLYELIGTCYFAMKNYLDSAGYYIKSLEINKKNFYSMYNLATIYILNKNYAKALEFLEVLKENEPNNEVINANIENLKAKLEK